MFPIFHPFFYTCVLKSNCCSKDFIIIFLNFFLNCYEYECLLYIRKSYASMYMHTIHTVWIGILRKIFTAAIIFSF